MINCSTIDEIAFSITANMKSPIHLDIIILLFLYYAISSFIANKDLKQTVLSLPVSRQVYIISLYAYIIFVVSVMVCCFRLYSIIGLGRW